MELKEFSHKGEAIEKEIKKEFRFMGRTIKKRRVGLLIAAIGVIAAMGLTAMQARNSRLTRTSYTKNLWEKAMTQTSHTMLKCLLHR